MSERQFVKVSVEERVALVTIDHPPVNALNLATLNELAEAVAEVIANDEAKAVVVTGAGQIAFVAGADISEFSSITDAAQAQALSQQGQALYSQIAAAPKPFIAALNGVALGGGLELAMACHVRIAGERVKLGQPEINLGIIPGWGGTQRLARLVGQAKAIELILTGDPITAAEAYRLNLINKVVPGGEVLKTARDLARKIAQKSGPVMRAALAAIQDGFEQPLAAGLALEAEQFGRVALTEDAREGVTAFVQKRQPAFKDR
jgi:enoyl-CoA hydratase/carnithine racemase